MQKTHYFQFPVSSIEETKSESGSDTLIIRGIASTPVIDRHDDIVDFEAMKRAGFGYMENPIVLLQHNYDKIIGKSLSYEVNEAEQKIMVQMELNNDLDGLYDNVRKGNLRALSIGFQLKDWRMQDTGDKQIRVITDLDLLEISVVSVPANPQAYFTLAKSLKKIFKELQEQPQSDDEIAGETPDLPTEEVVEAVNEEEGNPPQEEPEGNPQEVPVLDNRYEELSTRLDQTLARLDGVEEQLKATLEAVQKSNEVFAKSQNDLEETEKEMKSLKSKLAKQEIFVHKATSSVDNIRMDLRTGKYISL